MAGSVRVVVIEYRSMMRRASIPPSCEASTSGVVFKYCFWVVLLWTFWLFLSLRAAVLRLLCGLHCRWLPCGAIWWLRTSSLTLFLIIYYKLHLYFRYIIIIIKHFRKFLKSYTCTFVIAYYIILFFFFAVKHWLARTTACFFCTRLTRGHFLFRLPSFITTIIFGSIEKCATVS